MDFLDDEKPCRGLFYSQHAGCLNISLIVRTKEKLEDAVISNYPRWEKIVFPRRRELIFLDQRKKNGLDGN